MIFSLLLLILMFVALVVQHFIGVIADLRLPRCC